MVGKGKEAHLFHLSYFSRFLRQCWFLIGCFQWGVDSGRDRRFVVFTWNPSPFILQSATKMGLPHPPYLNCWKFIGFLFPSQEGKHYILCLRRLQSYFAVFTITLKFRWKQCRKQAVDKLTGWFQHTVNTIVSWASIPYTDSNFILFHLPNSFPFILRRFLHGNVKNTLRKVNVNLIKHNIYFCAFLHLLLLWLSKSK